MHDLDSNPDDQLERCETFTELSNGQEETSKFTATPYQETAGIICYYYNDRSYTIRPLSRTKNCSGGLWNIVLGGGANFQILGVVQKTFETTPKGFYCITLFLEGKKLSYGGGIEEKFVTHRLLNMKNSGRITESSKINSSRNNTIFITTISVLMNDAILMFEVTYQSVYSHRFTITK